MGPVEALDKLIGEQVTSVRDGTEATRLVECIRRGLYSTHAECIHRGLPTFEHIRVVGEPGKIIHVMYRGSTLCGIHTRPADWPLNEEWVPITNADSATCPACMEVYASQPSW